MINVAAYYQAIDDAYSTLNGSVLEARLQELLLQCKNEVGERDPFYAAMLNELGGYYRGQNRFSESEQCFLHALDIFRDLKPSNANLATTLNNLAGTHRLMGQHELAMREFSECLALYQAEFGSNHILHASALNNLSLVCLDQRDLEGAEHYLSQASAILSRLPKYQEEYASSLCNLANLHYFRKDNTTARAELEEAVNLHETTIGTRTPHYHSALHTLGIVLLDSGLVAEAYAALKKGVTAAEALYGPSHDHTKSIRHLETLVRQKLEAIV